MAKLAHFASEGVTVRIPQAHANVKVVQVAFGSWGNYLVGGIQPIRGVIRIEFEPAPSTSLPPEFDPPVELRVAYTAADWHHKWLNQEMVTPVELKLCKYDQQTNQWVDFPTIGPNTFVLVPNQSGAKFGGLGIVKIADPTDPRVGWY